MRCLSDLKGSARRAHRGDFIFHLCVPPEVRGANVGSNNWSRLFSAPIWWSWHMQVILLVNAWAVMCIACRCRTPYLAFRHDVSPPIYLPAACGNPTGQLGRCWFMTGGGVPNGSAPRPTRCKKKSRSFFGGSLTFQNYPMALLCRSG